MVGHRLARDLENPSGKKSNLPRMMLKAPKEAAGCGRGSLVNSWPYLRPAETVVDRVTWNMGSRRGGIEDQRLADK